MRPEEGGAKCLKVRLACRSGRPTMFDVLGVAIAFVAILAAGVRLERSLAHRREVAAHRATLDFISKFEIDNNEWTVLRANFRSLREKGDLPSVATPSESGLPKEEVLKVVSFLNYFELVAIGIENKIFDKPLYSQWFRNVYVRTWDDAASFVVEWRRCRNAPRAFIAFEKLASEWNAEIQSENGD